MTSTDSLAPKIPDKDAAGMQLEPKKPAGVSNSLSNKIPIPPPDGGSISITANIKDSPRYGTEGPFPEAPGNEKGGSFVDQVIENEPRNKLAIDFKEDSTLNILNISSSSSALRSVFTAVFWTGLLVSFTSFLRKIQPSRRRRKGRQKPKKF